ncbi:MAG: hypothetical protein KR126chlam1_01443 [Chlamydiae bacterium]|nr:hypothetical protein [Chlamydiota bacterium]
MVSRRKKWFFVLPLIAFLVWAGNPLSRVSQKESEEVCAATIMQWDHEELLKRLADISPERLERMRDAGEEIMRWNRILQKSCSNVVKEVLDHFEAFYEFEKYPAGDVIDQENSSQYFYHAHRAEEHGHFHTFSLHQKGPKTPTHLVAISMDRQGRPKGIFTTNQWVTAETLLGAEDLLPLIDQFKIELAEPSWLTNQWVGAMLILFYPQIVALLKERDRALEEWRQSGALRSIFEDRSHEVLTEMPISIEEQMEGIRTVMNTDRQCSES